MTRFVLDEDIPPRAAEIARGLGLDAVGVAELGRLGWGDEEQLRAAAGDGRVFVTYNRNDYILLTRRFFDEQAVHCGVLIVPGSLPRSRPERLAHALRDWETGFGAGSTTCLCTFTRGL
jgi:predicted nuclease of predicted toxin-antitoxin system